MRISATNNQSTNSKQIFRGNLVGKLPEELGKYSDEFEAYAKQTLASLPHDVIIKEGTSSEGKFINATVELPHCYSSNPIKVSSFKTLDDLKAYIDGVKNEATKLISSHKKCGFTK